MLFGGKGFIAVFFFFLFINSSFSKEYPWVRLAKDDLKVLADPEVEAELRLELVRSAKKSIDIITYDQRIDPEVGLPLIQALRDAANRGVRVRMMTSWSAHFLKDFMNYTGWYLTHPATRVPIQFVIVGGSQMQGKGWRVLDGIHEKLIVVDRKIAVMTGRGHAGTYLKWEDTSFIYKGKLVRQSRRAFRNLWKLVKTEMEFHKPHRNFEEGLKEKINAPSPLSLNLRQKAKLQEIVDWMKQPAVSLDKNADRSQFYHARLLHHDLLNQLSQLAVKHEKSPDHFSDAERLEYVEDSVVNETVRLLKEDAKSFYFSTLAVLLHPKLKEAILTGLDHGLEVVVFSNGKKAHQNEGIFGFPAGWYAGLSDLDLLLQKGALGISLAETTPLSPEFVHRKVAIIDDVSIFGSHNLSLASSIRSDEMSIEVIGEELAEELRELYAKNFHDHGMLMNPDIVHSQKENTSWRQWIGRKFKLLF